MGLAPSRLFRCLKLTTRGSLKRQQRAQTSHNQPPPYIRQEWETNAMVNESSWMNPDLEAAALRWRVLKLRIVSN